MSSSKDANSVYITDTNVEFVDDVSGRFRAAGWEVRSMGRGKDLLRLMEDEGAPRAILLSAILPDRNGMELCRAIKSKADWAGTKIVILTNFPRGSRSFVEAKTRFLADECLEQPVDITDLMATVARLAGVDISPKPGAQPEEKRKSRGQREIEKDMTGGRGVAPGKPRHAKAGPSIPDEGRLGEVLFPELLLSLYQRRASGTLRVQSLDEERRITLENGVPTAIDTNFIVEQALGSILVAQERITSQQLSLAQKEAKRGGHRLGEVLVDSGLMTSHELLETLHFQAQEKLVRAFYRNEGAYHFEPGTPPAREGGQIERGILQILLAGIRNHCTLPQLENRIYRNRDRVVMKNNIFRTARSGLQLTRAEWDILTLVNGRRTLGDIISESPLNLIRSFQVLYIYFLFGIVKFADEGEALFQLDEPMMNRALMEANNEAARRQAGKPRFDLGGRGDVGKLLHALYQLGSIGASGVLTVTLPDGTNRIMLSHGKPVSITSEPSGRFFIGALLIKKGFVREDELEEALERSRAQGVHLGEILLRSGLVTPHQLYDALVEQAETKLMDLLETTAGQEVAFEAFDEEETEKAPLEMDMIKVILAALRLHVDANRIAEELSAYMRDPVRMSAGVQSRIRQNLSDPKDAKILGVIDGKHSIEQIVKTSGQPREAVASLVYALYRLGMVEFERE